MAPLLGPDVTAGLDLRRPLLASSSGPYREHHGSARRWATGAPRVHSISLGAVPSQSSPAVAQDAPEVSIVIPCLDEAATLGAVIDKAMRALATLGVRGEVVVADNGSTDGSQAIAGTAGARVVEVSERGYGSALRGGFGAARGRFVVMGDADDTYDFGELGRFLDVLRDGAELVIGTRLPPGTILPGANPWLNRNLGTPVLTFLLNRLFGTRIRDVNCGLRGAERTRLLALDLRSDGMELASEMLIKAAVAGLRIAEVPVTLHPDRRGRPPHLRRWRDGWRHLELMLLHAPDQLLFAPGIVAFLVGLAVALPVSAGPLLLFGRLFDFHFLFAGGALTLIGLQGALGALLVRDVARDRVLRPNRVLSWLASRLTFGRGVALAVALFLVGFVADGVLLAQWIASGFGALDEPRRPVLALLLMTLGAELGVFSFLHAALRRHLS
ncbi:MAG: glycosyltransferase family 2 protein [Deltaproteobacteria bacterium]|nr:glycosyltransferase family 2 protein [Deltaproteobacteria bacterium]